MSEHQKNVHELAPFIAEALAEVANEATFPDTDERDWTERQRASHQFAVDIAEVMLMEDDRELGHLLFDTLKAHAEAARDAALEEYND